VEERHQVMFSWNTYVGIFEWLSIYISIRIESVFRF
jgi:hypothetical protein